MSPDAKPNLVAGQWIAGEGVIADINPSDTNDIVGTFARASAHDVEQAVGAAHDAAPAWARSGIQERHDVLESAGREIMARREEIGRLLSREEGKTLGEAVAETIRAARIFDFFAGECLRLSGEKLPSVRPDIDVEISRGPVGVVGIITPWNFPMAIPAWKIAPAICYGNTIVFKPAELVPACAWIMVDILHRAGMPPGTINLVNGPGSAVGQALLDDPRIKAVSFTGSQATGARVAEACVRHMRKVQLEMGGKNPLVVLDDADLENAVECAIDGSFFSTGQRCTASSRLIVTEAIHTRFVEACVERMRRLVVDDALDSRTDVGPVVDANQLHQDQNYIDIGRREGATLRTGGETVNRSKSGFYLEPALFTDSTSEMRINREEIFGPVAAIIRVRDYDEALQVANDTPFGLTAGICTGSLKHATHFKRNAEAGMVMVNLPTAGVDYHVPFGGTKGSSYGPREQGRYAAEFHTTVKTAYTKP